MQPRPLLVVLAAVFGGLSMVLVISAAVVAQPFVLLAALPLALTACLMWYQGTGRLAGSLFGRSGGTRRHRGPRTTVGGRTRTRSGDHAGPGGSDGGPRADSFREEVRREADRRARRQARQRSRRWAEGSGRSGVGADGTAGAGSGGAWRERRRQAEGLGGPTAAEAYEVLGLDPGASEEAVREAYRERAKTAHPDTEGGSAEAFQELNEAYERLVGP